MLNWSPFSPQRVSNPKGGDMVPHLYIHIPFCDGKCHYCGFYSVLNSSDLTELYTDLPACELQLFLEKRSNLAGSTVKTIYIGGGTPAMLGEKGLTRLISGISSCISIDSVGEWTVELNPASVTRSLLLTLKALGVNRLSIGVQSFDDATLARIGRRHNAEEACQAIEMAQAAGFKNTGVDLIAGLPRVSSATWQATLEKAISFNLTHLSVYALSLEPGTVLENQSQAGLAMPDEGAQLEALEQAERVLEHAGFWRYEISNYAMPGFECQHNLGIWRGNDFLGLGPAASSRFGNARWTNEADLAGYIEALTMRQKPPCQFETLMLIDDAVERMTFMLRLAEGLDPFSAAQRFPCLRERAECWEERLEQLARLGITQRGGARWQLTSRGRETCDAVIRELV